MATCQKRHPGVRRNAHRCPHRRNAIGRRGPAEEEALRVADAETAQHVALLGPLDGWLSRSRTSWAATDRSGPIARLNKRRGIRTPFQRYGTRAVHDI